MRYEDASGAFQASGPVANDDSDTLAGGQRGPATGNLITGEGTQYGAAGADSAAGAHITSIAGKGGEDSSFAGGKLSVTGEHGQLSVDAEGNYSYLANKGAPENVRDRFTYTLADNQGNSDTAALIVEIGKTPVVIKAGAQQIVPGPDGVVTLPPGVDLSDIMVVGRNLVINMPDGTQLIIIDGAVFVPQLVLGGVEIPATNVATLLIGQEPQPAAGELPPSSGGNFALPPPPLDPGIPLGDLLPPIENQYIPPEPQEVFDTVDEEPTIVIQPVDQQPAVNAVDQVDEAGLPARDGNLPDEPEGSGEGADGNPNNNSDASEATSGTIIIDSPDGVDSVTINGELVTGVIGQEIEGEFGTLTITGFDGDNILYSYLLHDNTSGDDTHDDFEVVLTDLDGDVAVATLTIDIIDDVPTARDDTDAVIQGDTSTDGNVMSSVGTTNSPAGADTVGADDAVLTGIHAGTTGSFTAVPGGGVTIVGEFGDLTIFPDGSYTYELHAEVGDGGTDVFTYQLTDGDGDTDTATLTITVPPDLQPIVGPNPTVLLDDDALANGNPGGVGDDPDAQNVAGTLSGSGGDGPLTFSVALTGAPAGFTYVSGGAGIVLIQQGGITVVTVTVNPDGSYTVEQNAPIDHAAGGNENNQSFTINYTVTDVDGDSADGTLTINVDDDTPELDQVVSQGDVTLDETDAGTPAGFPISDTSALPVIDFTALFGADGAAAVNSVEYGLVITGGPNSGLQTAVGDFPITLVQIDGDTIEGHYNGNNVAFIIQMNPDGTVTLTQNVPLEHLVDGPPGPDHNDSLDLGGLIAATVTITDGDGDQATAQAGIGDALVFLDDGPDAQVDEEATLDTLVLDETRPVGTEEDGDSNPAGLMTVQANFADNFVAPVDFGADGAGTVSYALFLNGTDVPSGLYAIDPSDTDAGDGDGYGQGEEIVLNQVGNTITGSAGGVDYFTITIDPVTGVVTFTQLDNIFHASTASDDDTSTLMAEVGSLLVQQIVTDSDGDFDTASVDVSQGVFQIEDDGPDAANDTDTVGDPGSTATGNVITDNAPGDAGDGDNGADDVGEDQPGTITDVVSDNEPLNTDQDPDPDVFEIQGEFGVLVMNADGSYTYTRDANTPGGEVDVFTYTLTDADGDSTTATLTITLGDATPLLPDPDLVQLDDDDVGSDGNPGGTGDDDPSGLPGQLSGSGGDGPLTYNFTGVDNLPAGFTAVPVDASTLEIYQGATLVLTITLNNSTGAFNVVQENPIDHPSLDGLAGDNTENNLEFEIGVEVEDNDGDTDDATITINVDDDTPVADDDASVTGLVDEDDLPAGNDDNATGDNDPGNADGDNDGTTTGGGAGSLFALFSFGADQPGTVSLSTDTSGLPALTSNGHDVLYQVVGGVLTAYVDSDDSGTINGPDSTAFTLTVNADGSWTFDLEAQLDHPTADTEDNLEIDFSSIIVGEDNDGDEVTAADGTFVVTVDDDLPVPADADAVTGLVDEDDLPAGNDDNEAGDDDPGNADGDNDGTTTGGAAGSLLALFDIGADQPGSVGLSTDTSGLPALTSDGHDVLYQVVGGVLTAYVDSDDSGTINGADATAFTLTVNADGSWEFDLEAQLDHPTADTEDNLEIDFSSIIVAEDADGDTATLPADSFVVTVDDDMPVINTVTDPLEIDNDASPSGTGTFDFAIGADQNSDNDDISVSGFTVQVNGVDATNVQLVEGTENSTSASYTFSFTYENGPGSTANATGTLVFDKTNGEYTVTLTSGPIEGFTIVQTSDPSTTFVEYDLNGGAPDVVVAQLGTDLFAQFVAVSTENNSPFEHLGTSAGNDTAWAAGELFIANPGNPLVSNTDAGVDGNTMDSGEVLDFNLYSADPGSDTTPAVPVTSATDMFMQFFQYTGDDLIVILKLGRDSDNDGDLDTFTTRAVIVDPGDVFVAGDDAALVGTAYEGMVAGYGVSDALLVIESNDYNAEGEDWVIVGAQIVTDDDGTSGTGINLDGDLGASGASDTNGDGSFTGGETQGFDTDTDVSGVKITSIGFLVQDTTDQSATIEFDVTVTDADGDTATQNDVTVNIGTAAPATLPPDPQSSEQTSSFSLLASDSQDQQLQKSAANSNALTLAAAVAAAGLGSQAAAHWNGHDGPSSEHANAFNAEWLDQYSADDGGDAAVSTLVADISTDASAPADTSSSSSSDPAESSHSVDDGSASAAASNDNSDAGDAGVASAVADVSPVAPAVAMVSAEALQAVAENGNAEQSAVEQVVADALGQGGAPTVDGILAHLPGGNGELPALAHMASPGADAVSGWDMAGHGPIGAGFDMLFKVDVAIHHQDAVQPAVNG